MYWGCGVGDDWDLGRLGCLREKRGIYIDLDILGRIRWWQDDMLDIGLASSMVCIKLLPVEVKKRG